jgi:hypothetical protein
MMDSSLGVSAGDGESSDVTDPLLNLVAQGLVVSRKE